MKAISHEDELRVQHYLVKSAQVSLVMNTLYRFAKSDLMRLLGRGLTSAERSNLYAEAAESVQLWLQSGQESQWRIVFRPPHGLYGQEITPSLVYTLNPLKPS